MKKINNGYTLTELLIAIAILSVVILSIIGVMNSASVTYKNSLEDLQVQESSQLLANQLEELLCDADDIGTSSDGGYLVKKGSDEYVVKFDSIDRTLFIKQNTGEYEVFADDMLAFSISGWESDGDNSAIIKFVIDNNDGNNATIERNIYFRNEVENDSFHDISQMTPVAVGPSTSGPSAITLNVNRYEEYNMTTLFGIRYDGQFSSNNKASTSSSYFTIKKNSNDKFVNLNNAQYYIITSSNALNKDFGKSIPITSNITFSGYDKPASDSTRQLITVVLTADAVSFVQIGTEKVNNHPVVGYYIDHTKTVNAGGYQNIIEMKGINVNSAMANGVGVSYNVTFYDKNNNKYGTTQSNKSVGTVNVSDVNNGASGVPITQIDHSQGRLRFGLSSDPLSNGLIVVSPNDSINNTAPSFNNAANNQYKDMYILLDVTFSGPSGATINSNAFTNMIIKYRAPVHYVNN